MNYLYIYPTSRAIRDKKKEYIKSNTLLPKFSTIADFEQKAILIDSKRFIDKSIRAIYLKEAANFNDFKILKNDLNLLKFYTKADDFFRFFEEVSAEGVTIKELYFADTYAEFERDLDILDKLFENYSNILKENGLTDKIFIPKEYNLNKNFINNYDGFVLELEGYLTKFELKLINDISKIKPFIIRLKSTKYNKKIIDSFRNLGLVLENNCQIEFNLSTKKVIKSTKLSLDINCEVIEVSHRFEQIVVAMVKVEELIKSGLQPENIVIILPDEDIADIFRAYDTLNNFNFAMGESYKKYSSFILLDELYGAINKDKLSLEYIARNNLNIEKKKDIFDKKMTLEEFFLELKEIALKPYSSEELEKELDNLNLLESYYTFKKVFDLREFTFKEWLFLWINRVKKHTIDDVRGGKVTIMGLLESRGVEFDGVVIVDFNEEYVPSVSNKDRFLNSSVRIHAKLPTKNDRENLQKYYYSQILQKAKRSVIIYQKSDENMPSKFLYELGLDTKITKYNIPLNILYDLKSNFNPNSYQQDVEIMFNAKEFVWSSTMLKIFLECKESFITGILKVLMSQVAKI